VALGTPTSRATVSANTTGATTASFTPAANSTLIAWFTGRRTSGIPGSPSISDSLGGTWTTIANVGNDFASSPDLVVFIARRTIGGSPASMTVTCSTTNAGQVCMGVFDITGADTDFSNTGSGTNTAGDPSATLGSAPAGTSTVIGVFGGAGTNNPTVPTGFTEIHNDPDAALIGQASYDATSPGQGAHAWSSTNTNAIGVVFEIKEAAAATNVNLTGVAGTGSAGTLTAPASKTLTGVSGTGAAGSFAKTAQKTLTGVAGTGAAGAITPNVRKTLTGVAGTGALGTILVTGADVSLSITGVSATGAAGALAKILSKTPTGVQGAGAAGTFDKTIQKSLTGAAGTGAAGTIGKTASKTPTGTAGTGAAGTFGKIEQKSLTGVAGSGAIGTITPTLGSAPTLVNLVGVQATLAVGVLLHTPSPALEGVSAAAEAGFVGFPENVTSTLVGALGSGQTGSIRAKVLGWSFDPGDAEDEWNSTTEDDEDDWTPVAPDQTDVWFVTSREQSMSGVGAKGEVGAIDINISGETSSVTHGMPGVAASGHIGLLSTTIVANPINDTVNLTGVQGLGSVGTIIADIANSNPTPSVRALTYDPDVVCPLGINVRTVTLTAPGPGAGVQQTITVVANETVIVRLPTTGIWNGQLRINGPTGGQGARVRIIGGYMRNAHTSNPGTGTNVNRILYCSNLTTVYIEGVRFDKANYAGTCIVHHGAPGGDMYVQNCLFTGVNYMEDADGDTYTQHGDFLQCQSQVRGLYVDMCTAYIYNTGFITNQSFASDSVTGAAIVNQSKWKRVNVNIYDSSRNPKSTLISGATSAQLQNHCAFFWLDGTTTPRTTYLFEDVYCYDLQPASVTQTTRRSLNCLNSPSSCVISLTGLNGTISGDAYLGTYTPPSTWATGVVKGGIPGVHHAKDTGTASGDWVEGGTIAYSGPGGGPVHNSAFTGLQYPQPGEAGHPGYIGRTTLPTGSKLTWNPANVAPLTGALTVDIPAAGLTATYGSTQDVLLRPSTTAKITGKVNITGGRNIRMLGGHFEMSSNAQNIAGGTIDPRWSEQIVFSGFTGAVYLEGLLLDRLGSVGEGITFAGAQEGTGDVYIQNSRIVNVGGIAGGGNINGSCVEARGPFRHVRIDRMNFSSKFEGLILPTRSAWVNGTLCSITVRRATGIVLSTPEAIVPLYKFRDGCGTTSPATDHNTPVTLEECYSYTGTTGKLFRETVAPTAHIHGSCGAVENTATTPDQMDWPDSENIFGVVKLGLPSTGDWAVAPPTGTQYLSGNKGQVHYSPTGRESTPLFICDDTFKVETLKTANISQSGRVFLPTGMDGQVWRGGYVHGLMTAETEYSMYTITGNGGAPFHFEQMDNFRVERLKVDGHCWDPIRCGTGARTPTILECWLQDARDDCIEADFAPVEAQSIGTITVKRTFMDNVHTYISSRADASVPAGDLGPISWHFEDCLLSLAANHRDSRPEQDFPWNSTDYGSGQPWKYDSDTVNAPLTMFLKGNTFMWQILPKTDDDTHLLIPSHATLVSGSTGNVFVWRGPQTSGGNGGLAMVTVPKIGGGTMSVPISIVGSGADRTRILAAFQFTDSQAYWDQKVSEWMANIWNVSAAPDYVGRAYKSPGYL
jgi:hypothetical protein